MSIFHLRIITPRKIVLEEEVHSVTIPSADGELTILPRHTNLFALLIEGVVKIKKNNHEDFLAIGGGYVQTDGKEISILVSKAYHQEEIDRSVSERAIEEARKILKSSTDEKQRIEAGAMLRRSLVDLKLLKKKAPRSFSENV